MRLPKQTHKKTQTPIVAKHNLNRSRITTIPFNEICVFCKFKNSMANKVNSIL